MAPSPKGGCRKRGRHRGTHILVIPAKAGIQHWSKELTVFTVPLFVLDTGMRRYDVGIGLLRHSPKGEGIDGKAMIKHGKYIVVTLVKTTPCAIFARNYETTGLELMLSVFFGLDFFCSGAFDVICLRVFFLDLLLLIVTVFLHRFLERFDSATEIRADVTQFLRTK
jgi:hypothetical protein